MDLLLLKLVVLTRAVGSVELGEALFALIGVGLFGLLVGAVLVRSAVQQSLSMSGVDWLIVAFAVWCTSASLIYFEVARVGELAKLLIPLLSYTLVKNLVGDQRTYRSMLVWVIVGLSIPALSSAALIATGSNAAISYVSYWTDLPRWKGVYAGAHSLGHSMTLLLMALVIFIFLRGSVARGKVPRGLQNFFIATLGIAAVYCLYMSQVRSALLGLLAFAAVYLYCYHRTLLIFGGAATAVLAVFTLPHWLPALLPEFALRARGIEVTTMQLGSGRPLLWLNDITVFIGLPIDQKIAGVGVGARGDGGHGEPLYGHSDWLELLTQTGLVGLALFLALQILFFKKILGMDRRERYAFLALFLAVNLMMIVSNSYAWRIQVGHIYYMILAYIEIGRPYGASLQERRGGTIPSRTNTSAEQN